MSPVEGVMQDSKNNELSQLYIPEDSEQEDKLYAQKADRRARKHKAREKIRERKAEKELQSEERAKYIAAVVPVLLINQIGAIYNLQQSVSAALENNDSQKAKQVLEVILKIQISPVKAMLQMAVQGVLPQDFSYQEMEVLIRSGLAVQYQTELPPMLKKLFDAGLVSADELIKLADSETGIDMINHIKYLALDADHEIDYSKLALILAIKQGDWNYVLNSNLLIEGQLEDHEDLIGEIHKSGRLDVLAECKKYNVFGFDENIYSNLDDQDSDGRTALMEAARFGDLAEVRKLLALGVDPALKDEDGFSALMHAVMYDKEDLREVNGRSSERSERINQLMHDKAEIVKLLVADKRVKVTEINTIAMDAFEIAIFQGLVTSEEGITELRGDHAIMDALISGGVSPVFGDFELSFKAKTIMTVALSVFVTYLKNKLESTTVGAIVTTVCPPVSWALNLACDAVVGYKAYYDAKNPLKRWFRSCLDSEYANDAFFSLDKKPLIGAYHINWMGRVYTGESLKNMMSTHCGYSDISSGYFSVEDLPALERLTTKERLELANSIESRFMVIQDALHGFLMPWTRKALVELSQELEKAHKYVKTGYELSGDLLSGVEAIANESNHAVAVKAINSSQQNTELFYQVISAMRSGALGLDLKTKHNLELLAQKVINPTLLNRTFMQRVWDYGRGVSLTSDSECFVNFSKVTEQFKVEGVDFGLLLQAMQNEFKKDLNTNRDLRTISERIHDGAASMFHYVVDRFAEGVGYVAGKKPTEIKNMLAEGGARGGASLNSGMHIGLRNFYDSKFFIPTCVVVALAFLTVKFPKQMWVACQYTCKAFYTVACATVTAVGMMFRCISKLYNYVRQKEATTALDMVEEEQSKSAKSVVSIDQEVMKSCSKEVERAGLLSDVQKLGLPDLGMSTTEAIISDFEIVPRVNNKGTARAA